MADVVPGRGLRVLSLDGGGVRGLSTLMILEYLMKSINRKDPPKPCDVFDIIGGTSTGGLIAIMLGRLRMTVSEAISEYLNLSQIVFAPKHRFNLIAILKNVAMARGRCDTEALEEEIKKVVVKALGNGQENALLMEDDPACRSFVCAIRREKKSLICFRNFDRDSQADLEPTIWQAARATSAATSFFDPVQIGKYDQEFVDGGAGHNCPVNEAFKEAKACWSDPPRDFQCIVSIGTGKGSLKPFGKNLLEVGQSLLDIATDADETAAKFADDHPEFMDEGAQRRFFRFQVQHGLEKVGMAEHTKIKEIAAATQIYMETSELDGCKQLKLFKEVMGGPQNEARYKMTSVPLEPDRIRYIEKHAKALGFQGPAMTLPSKRNDYICGTLRLPKKIFAESQPHVRFRGKPPVGTDPTWLNVLKRYCEPSRIDEVMNDVPVHETTWCEEYGGLFAVEIPVADIWRIIGSYNPYCVIATNEPNTETEIHVEDLWISVPGSLHGKPLVHMAFRSGTIFTGPRILLPSHEYAAAICGIGGFRPDRLCDRAIFASAASHWEVVRQPLAFAFTLLPLENRCYFREQWEWLTKRTAKMIRVCGSLWDHVEAIDLDCEDVPVKVRLRDFPDALTSMDGYVEPKLPFYTDYKIKRFDEIAQQHLQFSPEFSNRGYFIEIEDAVTLLEKAGSYLDKDFIHLNEDGETEITRDWWGYFGEPRARWVALAMTAKMLLNMCQSFKVPDTFGRLLHSPSGTCYVV